MFIFDKFFFLVQMCRMSDRILMPTNTTLKLSKSSATKHRIGVAFLELIQTMAWDKVTVKALCSQAHITRGTFYNYFNDVYDLLEEIENDLLNDLTTLIKNARAHKVSFYIESTYTRELLAPHPFMYVWAEFCRVHKDTLIVFLDDRHGNDHFENRLRSILTKEFSDMMDEDNMPNDDKRFQYIQIYIEIFFMVARTRTRSSGGTHLSDDDMMYILNSFRIGGRYNLTPHQFHEESKKIRESTDYKKYFKERKSQYPGGEP